MLELADVLDPAGTERSRRTSRLWEQRDAALRQAVAQLWQWLFREPWPAHVRVRWVPSARAWYGYAGVGAHSPSLDGELVLCWALMRRETSPLTTVLHEFAHLRGYDHGAEMYRAVKRWCDRLGLPADESCRRGRCLCTCADVSRWRHSQRCSRRAAISHRRYPPSCSWISSDKVPHCLHCHVV